METLLQFSDLMPLCRYATEYSHMGSDYMYLMFNHTSGKIKFPRKPMHIAGMGICLVLNGTFLVESNGQHYTAQTNSIISTGRNIPIKIAPKSHEYQIMCLFMSSSFIQDLNIDLNAVNLHQMVENPVKPVFSNLSPTSTENLSMYMRLLHNNACNHEHSIVTKNIARSTSQAFFYEMLRLFNALHTTIDKSATNQSRQLSYVQEFMRLVQMHHVTEREVKFYSQKLCISSKYLSHIIKETTGKSAMRWIADFVVMEAKNQLRFSNKTVQQIAYDLNFKTQSSFGKYFKHITGMSPSEFQKT